MNDLLFYGGTIAFWIGLLGCYASMKKLRNEHGNMNFQRLRVLANEGNDTAKTGLRLLVVAAAGVVAQISSIIMGSAG
jgi:hypothetical protein